mgnify:FL=1
MSIKLGSKPWRIWSSHWNRRTVIYGLRLPFALISAIIVGCGFGYLATNHFANWRTWQAFDPQIGLDTAIPVLPWMIIPYATLYLYYPMAAVLGMKNADIQRENVIFHQTFLLLTWIIFAIFILLPVEVDIRDEVSGVELGLWQGVYDLLHAVDTPWNAWPSLHIVQSLLAVFAVTRWYNSAASRWHIRFLWFAWIMLVLSVVATKQHFVWDVASGIIIATVAWKFWILPLMKNSHSEEVVASFEAL